MPHPNRNQLQLPPNVRPPQVAYQFMPILGGPEGILPEEVAMILSMSGMVVGQELFEQIQAAGMTFTPTRDKKDADGNVILGTDGKPEQETDPDKEQIKMSLARHFQPITLPQRPQILPPGF